MRSVTQETARGGIQKIKAQPDDISVRGIELEPAVAGLMTKASLDGSPRSPPIPRAVRELRQNAMETSPALAGFFLFRMSEFARRRREFDPFHSKAHASADGARVLIKPCMQQ